MNPVRLSVGILLIFVVMTIQRNHVWGDEVRLWQDVTQKSPLKTRGWMQLGAAYQKRGDYTEALKSYQHCVQMVVANPDRLSIIHNVGAGAMANIASILIDVRQFDNAAVVLSDARNAFPPHVDVWTNLVALYIRTAQWEAALNAANEALTAWPSSAVLHFNRGDVLGQLDRCSEARMDWQAARQLDRATRYPVRECRGARG